MPPTPQVLPRSPRPPRDETRRREDTQDGCRGDRPPRRKTRAIARASVAPTPTPLTPLALTPLGEKGPGVQEQTTWPLT